MATTLTSLLAQTHITSHAEILSTAETSLKQMKGTPDLKIQQIKLLALLHLDRFAEAAKFVEGSGNALKEQARLEWAYALYKAGKPREAADVAGNGGNERGLRHVEAQARYRCEEFGRAKELYAELAERLEGDAEADLRVNLAAVEAQLAFSGQSTIKKAVTRGDLEVYETAYNAACECIARGEFGQAEVLLKRAEGLCEGLVDLDEEERQTEVAPIKVQRVYVLIKLGRLSEADALAKSVNAVALGDKSLRFIARVNGIAAQTEGGNPYLNQRLLGSDMAALGPDLPFEFQSSILRDNRYAQDLQMMKFGGTAASTQAVLAKETGPKLDRHLNGLSVVNAAAHAKNQTGKGALKHILPLLEKQPHDVGLLLTIVQLYVLTGNTPSAINLVEKFTVRLEQAGSSADDVRFAPGLVAVATALYNSQKRRDMARATFAKAAGYWRRKGKERPAGVMQLLKAAGSALLESDNAEEQNLASDIFAELHEADANDRYAAAGLLAASTSSDSAQLDKSNLTPLDRLLSPLDAAALESSGIASLPKSLAPPASLKRPNPAVESAAPKPHKKPRPGKLPKEYDPAKTPDPERWLPLKDRSSYRPPKGKKGKARRDMLAQGAVGGESEGSRPATPGAEVVKGKGGSAPKKGKGKGKK